MRNLKTFGDLPNFCMIESGLRSSSANCCIFNASEVAAPNLVSTIRWWQPFATVSWRGRKLFGFNAALAKVQPMYISKIIGSSWFCVQTSWRFRKFLSFALARDDLPFAAFGLYRFPGK